LSRKISPDSDNKDQVDRDLEVSRLLEQSKKIRDDGDELMPPKIRPRHRGIRVHLNTSLWPPLTITKEPDPKRLTSPPDELTSDSLKSSQSNEINKQIVEKLIADSPAITELETDAINTFSEIHGDQKNITVFGFSAPWVVALSAVILAGVAGIVYALVDTT
jgi:hypothetical protein